jgi:hypothetical protein
MSQANGIIRDKDGKIKNVTYDYLDIKGDDAASQFFKFVADYTEVEWACIKTGTNDNRIGTAYKKSTNPAGSLIVVDFIEQGINIREDIHSHPDTENSNPQPSKFDIRWAKFCDKKYSDKAPRVYKVYSAKTKEYYQY